MNENEPQRKLIEKKKLASGLVLSCYDLSRKLAGDRWYVQLCCEVVVPVIGAFFGRHEKSSEPDAQEIDTAIRKMLGDSMTFAVIKERHFVDEKEKDSVIAELMGHVVDHMISYLDNPAFPQRLFNRRYEECKNKILLEKRMDMGGGPEEDEDDGPADFSFCFTD